MTATAAVMLFVPLIGVSPAPALGGRLIASETDLDRQFASKSSLRLVARHGDLRRFAGGATDQHQHREVRCVAGR